MVFDVYNARHDLNEQCKRICCKIEINGEKIEKRLMYVNGKALLLFFFIGYCNAWRVNEQEIRFCMEFYSDERFVFGFDGNVIFFLLFVFCFTRI